jgi:hypothetical protein
MKTQRIFMNDQKNIQTKNILNRFLQAAFEFASSI